MIVCVVACLLVCACVVWMFDCVGLFVCVVCLCVVVVGWCGSRSVVDCVYVCVHVFVCVVCGCVKVLMWLGGGRVCLVV